MSEAIYQTLAKVLDTLPNGFPATESGVEIKLLKNRPSRARSISAPVSETETLFGFH